MESHQSRGDSPLSRRRQALDEGRFSEPSPSPPICHEPPLQVRTEERESVRGGTQRERERRARARPGGGNRAAQSPSEKPGSPSSMLAAAVRPPRRQMPSPFAKERGSSSAIRSAVPRRICHRCPCPAVFASPALLRRNCRRQKGVLATAVVAAKEGSCILVILTVESSFVTSGTTAKLLAVSAVAEKFCRRCHRSSGRRCRSRWLPGLPINRFSYHCCFVFLVRSSVGEGCHRAPHLLQTLLSHLAQAIADNVVFQVESGAHCIQILIHGVDNYHLICGNAGQSLISKRL